MCTSQAVLAVQTSIAVLVLREPRIARLALPLGKLPLGFVLGHAVALLDLAGELVAAAGDDIEVVIGQLAPLLLRLP